VTIGEFGSDSNQAVPGNFTVPAGVGFDDGGAGTDAYAGRPYPTIDV
jgi:hypothetical protein